MSFSSLFSQFAGSFGDSLFPGASRLLRPLGRTIGGELDDLLFGKALIERGRLEALKITQSGEGGYLPRIFGSVRVGGRYIWISPVREAVNERSAPRGAWGVSSGAEIAEYHYYVSAAIALCDVTNGIAEPVKLTAVYADGEILDLSQITYRFYDGSEAQLPDFLITASEGDAPAFRGVSYIMLEDIPLSLYGNRLPNFTFDLTRVTGPRVPENLTKAFCMIPATGEFAYATTPVIREEPGQNLYENQNAHPVKSDFVTALDRMQSEYPNVARVSLVTAWFGSHLNAGECAINPKIDAVNKITRPLIWNVAGVNRAQALQTSRYNGNAAYGGTPSDNATLEGMRELASRGLTITFYPFLLQDIPEGTAENLPPYPWRGRITAQNDLEIDRFFDGFAGSKGWRAMILHYANLCKTINTETPGAVESFLIGSEFVGLTRSKTQSGYHAVTRFRQLAAEVRGVLGASVKISYAADWTEYGAKAGANGDLDFPLDPLWADANIDFIGLDWYAPLTDWRDGTAHLDAVNYETDRDPAYLRSRIEGGETYDWYYADQAGRDAQQRLPITDGAYQKPFVYRTKDIRGWWLSLHYPRVAGVESATPTAFIPQSKPIIFTELGCPAVNKGANSPNLFPDFKSSENGIPPYSDGSRDDGIQRALLEAYLTYWNDSANNPVSALYAGLMIDMSKTALWCYDARPYPAFPALESVWTDAPAWNNGHWLSGRGGFTSFSAVAKELCHISGLTGEIPEKSDLRFDGYTLEPSQSPASALAELAFLTGHDAIVSDVKKIFFPRKEGVNEKIIPIPDADFLLFDPVNSPVRQSVNALSEAPDRLRFRHDAPGKTENVETILSAPGAETAGVTAEISLPIHIFSDYARSLSSGALHRLRMRGEREYQFTLPFDYFFLEPGDLLRIPDRATFRTVRIIRLEYDDNGLAVFAVAADYLPLSRGLTSGEMSRQNTAGGAIMFLALDLPAFRDTDTGGGGYFALRARKSPDSYGLYLQPLTNAGFVNGEKKFVRTISTAAMIGKTETDFYPVPAGVFDETQPLWVTLPFGEKLSAASDAEIANGKNLAAIINGTHKEIFGFARAELTDPAINKYKLSRITRGLFGTEVSQGNPTAAGASFVILNDAIRKIETPQPIIAGNYRVIAAPISRIKQTEIALIVTV